MDVKFVSEPAEPLASTVLLAMQLFEQRASLAVIVNLS
jgi:hypothetical protein